MKRILLGLMLIINLGFAESGFLNSGIYYTLENGKMTIYMDRPDSPNEFRDISDRLAYQYQKEYITLKTHWVSNGYMIQNFYYKRVPLENVTIYLSRSY